MPQRKPFRPHKNRPRDRAQGGSDDRQPDRTDDGRRKPRGDAKRREKPENQSVERKFSKQPETAEESGDSKPSLKGPKGSYWIYGNHAVLAAIDNPNRRIRRLVQSEAGGARL